MTVLARARLTTRAAPLAAAALAACGCASGPEPTASAPDSTRPPRTPAGTGVSVVAPRGWHLIRPPITALTFPAERLLLTSYPTRRGGNCGPDRAVRDLPRGGALAYLFEYRPQRGDVWEHLHRGDFPPRPAHFRLRRRDLGNFECWGVPSYLIHFRAADRPFQLHVALGADTGARRRAQVLRILDSLRFSPLPPPPPDPYARWRLLTTETGDSLRTPPGWPAATTTGPRRYPRPRTLLFASNRRLAGLPPAPPRRNRAARRLPTRVPARALNAMPDDGVLLWVREAPKGPPSAAFPRVGRRAWPQATDFRVVQAGTAERWPRLRWERAGSERRRHRFAVWIIRGPGASERDRATALKSAAALAVSTGSYRDLPCRRACRTG